MPPVQPISISAGCTRNCSGQRTTGRPDCWLIVTAGFSEIIIALEDPRSEFARFFFLQAELAPAEVYV